jgi:hypothetical protein
MKMNSPDNPETVESLLVQHIRKELQSVSLDGEQYFYVMYKATAYLISSEGNIFLLLCLFDNVYDVLK